MSAPSYNVLWLVTTQWRAQAHGFAGDKNARTPALDALERRSINYTQAITPHPFGPFARAAMLTGVESPHNGVRDYFDPLPQGARTVAHAFAEEGYQPAYFGKWHLGKRDAGAALVGESHARIVIPFIERGGFEMWEAFEGGFQLQNPWLHGTRLPAPVQFSGYQSDVLCERAGAWLREETHAPWFCVVSLEPPHPPYDAAPVAYWQEEAPLRLRENVPADVPIRAQACRELAGYYAHIQATDAALGRLLDTIDFATTVVVVTSVHGDMHGSHGLFRKGWPHEESVRIPLLVSAPGQAAGRRQDNISLSDLPDLSLTFARGEFWSVGERAAARISMPSVVQLPHQCDRLWRGWRTPEWKLVLTAGGEPWLCFDLQNDPLEMRNLVGDSDYRKQIEELLRRFGKT